MHKEQGHWSVVTKEKEVGNAVAEVEEMKRMRVSSTSVTLPVI